MTQAESGFDAEKIEGRKQDRNRAIRGSGIETAGGLLPEMAVGMGDKSRARKKLKNKRGLH